MAVAAAVLWAHPQGPRPRRPVVGLAGRADPAAAVSRNSFGWIFTEIGRQPWIVFGLMTTATGVSPAVSAGEVVTSLIVFTLLYGVLAVVEVKLFLTYVRRRRRPLRGARRPDATQDEDAPLAFAY